MVGRLPRLVERLEECQPSLMGSRGQLAVFIVVAVVVAIAIAIAFVEFLTI